MGKKLKVFFVLPVALICVAIFLSFETPDAVSADAVTINVIRNGFALGVNNDYCPKGHDPAVELINSAEWSYDEYITISKCGTHKNSHPYDLEIGGAMFKNGPIENSGFGLPGVPAHMWQEYDLVALGVPAGEPIAIDLTLELVSVGGTLFTAVMESSIDGEMWTPQATLIQWPQESCGIWKYPLYCGSAIVPYAPYYRLALTSVWTEQLGQKWVVHLLNFSFEEGLAATPTATSSLTPETSPTPLPTATPTASLTPTATQVPPTHTATTVPSITATASATAIFTPTPTSTSSSTPTIPPSLSLADVSIVEGNEGFSRAVFVAELDTAVTWPIEVNFETYSKCCSDQYAENGFDYEAAAGTITFNAGETVQTIEILVIGDEVFEGDETFYLTLSTNDLVIIENSTASGRIVNDDQNDVKNNSDFQLYLPIIAVTK